VAKRRRREQQHLRQESARKRQYTVGGSQNAADKYKPGFPMNLLANAKIFYIAGAIIMIGSVVVAAVLAGTGNNSSASADLPTPTVTPTVDPNATPTATPTPDPRQFSAADQVIDAQTKDYRALIKTSMGDFTINLFADQAPNTVNSFVFLAQKDYFDGLTFHRIRDGFVIQGGDPKGNGTGGPGYLTQEEPNEIRNTRGTLSMAKSSGSDQFGSQFFINLKDNTSLDFDNPSQNRFYPFAEVVEGMDVIDAIAKVPVEPNEQGETSKPVEPVTITDVVIEESSK
jgi:cyclophilin family peptidyl-prolyl cis-trans isomerase